MILYTTDRKNANVVKYLWKTHKKTQKKSQNAIDK